MKEKQLSKSNSAVNILDILPQKTLNVATVFSGIGAPEQALKRIGCDYKLLFACDNGEREISYDHDQEFDKICNMATPEEKRLYVDNLYKSKTSRTNFVQQSFLANYHVENDNFYQDVTLLDGRDYKGKVDLFVGGSPCQSFSIAGARGGFEDTRGTLFFEYCRLVKEIEPTVFIYENVYGVLNHDGGRTWDTMQNVFNELGYSITWNILDARNYGIPQGRRRLFVVGFKKKASFDKFSFPEPVELKFTMQDFLEENLAIGSLQSVDGQLTKINDLKGEPDQRYYLSPKLEAYVMAPGTKNFHHPNAKTDLPIARALVKNMGNTYRASVNNYVHTHGKIRHLTMREVHRLMGYPDSYKIVVSRAQAYKQAGNSIVVDVMMNIIKQIFKAENWEK
jgi:DNA (cytosine-5)-methyltransferase 1